MDKQGYENMKSEINSDLLKRVLIELEDWKQEKEKREINYKNCEKKEDYNGASLQYYMYHHCKVMEEVCNYYIENHKK